MPPEDWRRSAREARSAMQRLGEVAKRAAADCRRCVDEFYAPYEAERAVALFEGRVPPSPEVFFASLGNETSDTPAPPGVRRR